MESERARLQSQIDEERRKADKASQQLSNYHKADRQGTLVVKCEIETQHVQKEERFTELQQQLDKVSVLAINAHYLWYSLVMVLVYRSLCFFL